MSIFRATLLFFLMATVGVCAEGIFRGDNVYTLRSSKLLTGSHGLPGGSSGTTIGSPSAKRSSASERLAKKLDGVAEAVDAKILEMDIASERAMAEITAPVKIGSEKQALVEANQSLLRSLAIQRETIERQLKSVDASTELGKSQANALESQLREVIKRESAARQTILSAK